MGNILFIIFGNRFKIVLPIIELLSRRRDIYILFLSEPNLETKNYIRNNKIKIVNIEENKYFKTNTSIYRSLQKFSNLSVAQFFLEKLLVSLYEYIYNIGYDFLKEHNIKCVYSHNDRYSSSAISYLKAAYNLDIPIIIPAQHPIEIDQNSTDKENSNYKLSKNNNLYQKYIFKFFYNKFKDQVYNNMFFYYAYELNALYKFNSLSKNPWIVGSSKFTTKLCLINTQNQIQLNKYKYLESKIHITGSYFYDFLFFNQKSYKKGKKRIIVTLTQLYEHNYMNYEKAQKEHEYILNIFSKFKEYEIIVSLAPMMNIKDYLYLENKYNCTISKKDLFNIIHTADLYFCSVSATAYWSIILGIKTVVYNVYDWKYLMLDNFNSILYITKKECLYERTKKYLDENIDFNNDQNLLSKDKFLTGEVLNNYIKLTKSIENIKTKNFNHKNKYDVSVDILNKYSDLLSYIKQKRVNRILKQFSTGYYISPYSLLTTKLQEDLNKNFPQFNFLGYIDSFVKKENVFSYSNIDFKDKCILIYSPNHYKEITYTLKKFLSSKQLFNI